MTLALSRIIFYVHDVNLLKAFYVRHFDLSIVEEIEPEWAVMQAGAIEIALHRVGRAYRGGQAPYTALSNTKLVFTLAFGLAERREQMISAGIAMRDLKRYDGFPYLLCDGEDPEGNVFQLMQHD
ncbi:VOC family protein [Dyella choica]|uniref:VOC family protein n=1 Tax=Dyella choica TaxID=1927959 RepID=A0A3S0R1N7_9GAMM|nr:VOC family protein [Dyella choica]RUL72178.1 VOC family protein [Dyella choica]